MNRVLRRLQGSKVREDGATITLALQTVEGIDVEIELLPEMVKELVLALLKAAFEAEVASEAGLPTALPEVGNPMRMVIPAKKLISAAYPDEKKRLVQIETEGGTVLEFLLPAPVRPED